MPSSDNWLAISYSKSIFNAYRYREKDLEVVKTEFG